MNQIIYAGKHLLTYSVSRHAHTSWELIYCTGGSGCLSFDGNSLPYQAGDVVVIPPFFHHSNVSSTGFTNIHLNMLNPALHSTLPFLVHDSAGQFILQAFTAAFYQFSSHPGQQTALLACYANLIVCLLQDNQNAPAHSQIVQEIEQNIIRNYPDCNYELDSYLRSLPFNYDYIRKLFKNETGVTPHRYLSDIRLQTAAENLSVSGQQDFSVSEIARLCGFREPLYFSRMFKKKYGVSPSMYQNSLRQPLTDAPNADSIKIP